MGRISHLDGLHSCEDGSTSSEDDHYPIYKDLTFCLCHSFKVKHGRVNETKWYAINSKQRPVSNSRIRTTEDTHQAKLPTKLTNLSKSFAPAQLTK